MLRLHLSRIALFARRRYRTIFAVTALLIVGALLLASRLKFDTDVLALLPRNEPVVNTFRQSLEEFGSVDYLPIVVRVPEGVVLEPYEAFVDRIGERLATLEQFERVDYRLGELDDLLREFLPKSLLFLAPDDLEQVAALVSDESLDHRARELRRLVATPQSLVVKDLIKLDPFGLAELFVQRMVPSQAGLSLDWTSGYLLSRDRRMLLVLAKPRRPPQDVDFAKRLIADVEREIDRVRPEWAELAGPDRPPPEVALGGRYVIAIGDERIIRNDVIANVLTSMVGVLLLFLLAFRRFGPLLYAFIPLSCGLILTFGLSAVAYGGLSAATSGTAALLIGLGIDFVIVSYGRFVEERRRGVGLSAALARMSGSSGRAVVVGGVTSAATFYSFGVTDFTGLYQMGYLTGTGILFCMLAVLLLLPAMLAWNEDHHQRRQRYPKLVLHGMGGGFWIRMCLRNPRTVVVAGVVLTVLAALSVRSLRFEDSVRAMRPKGNPASLIRDEIAQRFGSGFDQMMLVVRGDSMEEAVALADRAATEAQPLVDSGVLKGIDSIGSLLPPPQRQRRALDWLAEARADRLDPRRIRERFSAALAAQGLREAPFTQGISLFLEAVERTEPIGLDEINASPQAATILGRYLLETEEGWKSAVYLYPPPVIWLREPPPQAVAIAEALGPEVTLTGANVVSSFLRTRVLEDAVAAAALGLLLVTILLWLDYGKLRDGLVSLVPLAMGILWMLGMMAALDIAMNFMNIFVTTMIIGIGVDYGVHMIHRYREFEGEDDAQLFGGLTETGKAILLAAMSTVVGFGSLSRSHYPGLASMGVVAILGAASTCLVAISLLPAWIALRRRRRRG